MGYCETLCQLCGVSFAIARIRCLGEPESAAWDYSGTVYVDISDDYEDTCENFPSGCQMLERENDGGPEHIAGPGCISAHGYSGSRISLEEMKGCRAVQALVQKDSNWAEEDDDQDFERESDYFLTGIGDGSPDEAPLEGLQPVRHGLDSVLISNCLYGNDEALPFHPSCFKIFQRVSNLRLGFVDVEGLWYWRELEPDYEDFFERGPHDYAARQGNSQWWNHEPGCEYLVANPLEIPGLPKLLRPPSISGSTNTAFGWRYKRPDEHYSRYHRTPPPLSRTANDPFLSLAPEITSMVLGHLGSKDIASLRLSSSAFRQLPNIIFRRLLLEDMPFMWEVRDLPADKFDFHAIYVKCKFLWINLKGVQNRKRIWYCVEEIVRRIQKYRVEGKVGVSS